MDDLYSDSPEAPSSKAPMAPPKEGEDKQGKSEEALLPKSFFMGKETPAGSYWEIKVVGETEDEVRVTYSVGVDKSKEDKKESMPMKGGGSSEMDSMYS